MRRAARRADRRQASRNRLLKLILDSCLSKRRTDDRNGEIVLCEMPVLKKRVRGEFESRVCLPHVLTLEGFRLNPPNLIEPTLERIRIHSREIWNAPNQ